MQKLIGNRFQGLWTFLTVGSMVTLIPGTFAVLSVCDHGSGIPKDILDRIFDPLFSTKEVNGKDRKRGWDLAIIFALIRRRGGWIDVTSIPGEGSTFEVFLPLQSGKEIKA
jgi:two-component system cell cycle sensor histidine kinase/response regulator CckA